MRLAPLYLPMVVVVFVSILPPLNCVTDCTDAPTLVRKVGEGYPPSVMPGYGGPWFQLSPNTRLLQLDITDPAGTLIPPWDWYKWIAEGSLAYMIAEMCVYFYKEKKYYSLSVKSLQILDKGDADPSRPERHLIVPVDTAVRSTQEPLEVTLPSDSPGKIVFSPSAKSSSKGKQKEVVVLDDPDSPSKHGKRKNAANTVTDDARSKRNRK
ncbi:hypothetical protein K435DRAFT_872976 [Dendrothele bispora CBS 962.96]|uniref:Uncharacterized protein n=1 Tax=Dendrothele bispora (strain CBS 962.96) TaxID=1314807 RepID=A0A4S8L0B4_DENBC|nr:hypothetical protein K435DRAFT_872976 [Dendrothele bispora CBS 962.96]